MAMTLNQEDLDGIVAAIFGAVIGDTTFISYFRLLCAVLAGEMTRVDNQDGTITYTYTYADDDTVPYAEFTYTTASQVRSAWTNLD